MRYLTFAAVFVCSFSTASACWAEEVPDDIMINTVKCEAGKVAVRMVKAGMPNDKKVIVSWAHTKTIKREAGIGLTFPFFSLGGAGDLSKEELHELKSDGQQFNLHPDNEKKVCRKIVNRIVREGVGVYDCLVEQKFATLGNSIEQGTGSASCKTTVTLSKKISGNLRVKLWGVDAGPSGSWGDIEVYEIAIAAPNSKK